MEDTRISDIDISDIDKTMGSSGSQRLSMGRSLSRGSSGSKHSFRISYVIPGAISAYETQENGDVSFERTVMDIERRQKVSLKRLAYLNKPEVPVLIVGSIAATIHGVIFPMFGLLLSSAIKMFYEPQEKLQKDSRFWALVFVGLGCLSLTVLPVQNYFFGVAGGRLIERIRSLTFEKVVHQEISWFDDPANSRCVEQVAILNVLPYFSHSNHLIFFAFISGAVGARLSTDASTVRSLVGDALALVVQNISTIISALLIAFTANWELALIILAVLPILFMQGYFQMKFMTGFSADAKVRFLFKCPHSINAYVRCTNDVATIFR